jgi:hypothetical protein
MTVPIRLLFLVLALDVPGNTAAQGLEGLAGSWALDTVASPFEPGDAVRLDIRFTATEVSVTRIFKESGPPPSELMLALDGSPPLPPKVGSARAIDGKLIITHNRAREVVTHTYAVEGTTLLVERSIQANAVDGVVAPLKRTIVFRRIG